MSPRKALVAALLVGAGAGASSCGEGSNPSAEPSGPAARDPIHLVVSGTDREMGLAHGNALSKEIREEVGPRLRARLRAVARDLAEAKFLEDSCRLYTRKTAPLLPPEVREELAGIAEGSGVPEEDLLLLEVLHEGLRFHLDRPPLVEASLVSPPFTGDPNGAVFHVYAEGAGVVAAWDGTGGVDLSGHALILERRPVRRDGTLVVTWPGGLGALAGTSRRGLLFAEGEVPIAVEHQSLHGTPFAIGARIALETARDAETFFSKLVPLSANRVLAGAFPEAGSPTIPPDLFSSRRLGLSARVVGDSVSYTASDWVAAAAGPGAPDARSQALAERVHSLTGPPTAPQAVACAVSGRGAKDAAVVWVTRAGIRWLTRVGADGKVGPDGKDLAFPFEAPPK